MVDSEIAGSESVRLFQTWTDHRSYFLRAQAARGRTASRDCSFKFGDSHHHLSVSLRITTPERDAVE